MIENNASTSLDDHPINTLRIEDIIAFYLTEKNRCKGKYVPLTEDILDRGYSKDFMWTLIRNIRRNEISAILLKPITNDWNWFFYNHQIIFLFTMGLFYVINNLS